MSVQLGHSVCFNPLRSNEVTERASSGQANDSDLQFQIDFNFEKISDDDVNEDDADDNNNDIDRNNDDVVFIFSRLQLCWQQLLHSSEHMHL